MSRRTSHWNDVLVADEYEEEARPSLLATRWARITTIAGAAAVAMSPLGAIAHAAGHNDSGNNLSFGFDHSGMDLLFTAAGGAMGDQVAEMFDQPAAIQ